MSDSMLFVLSVTGVVLLMLGYFRGRDAVGDAASGAGAVLLLLYCGIKGEWVLAALQGAWAVLSVVGVWSALEERRD
jgi:hypothetical protein